MIDGTGEKVVRTDRLERPTFWLEARE